MQEAFRLVGAVAVDKGGALLLREHLLDLAGEPLAMFTAASSNSVAVAAGMA